MLQNTQFGMSGPTAPGYTSSPGIEIVTTVPRVALAVTPHPDDCEGGCGGALAKWVKEFGAEAVVVMCTNGNKGTSERDMTPGAAGGHPRGGAARRVGHRGGQGHRVPAPS